MAAEPIKTAMGGIIRLSTLQDHYCDGHIIHFICIPAVHIISLCVSFLSRVDELHKLACSPCMGLHNAVGRALQRERKGHAGSNLVEAPKTFSSYFTIA